MIMKKLTFIVFLSLSIITYAKTTTSITDGPWNNNLTWDNGVPVYGDDVIVNHNVTLNGNIGIGGGSLTVNAGATLNQSGTRNITMYSTAATFVNNGTVTCNNIDGEGIASNHGTLNANRFSIYNSGKVINTGNITAVRAGFSGNSVLRNLGTFQTTGNATPTFQHSGDSLVNEGTFSTHYLESTSGNYISNSSTGTITTTSLADISDTDIDNSGQISFGGNFFYNGNGTFNNSGQLDVSGNLQAYGTTQINNTNIITVGGIIAGTSNMLNNGVITVGGGTFHNYAGTITSTTCGYIDVGASNDYMNYSGSSTTGNLVICGTLTNFGGTVAGTVTFSCTNTCLTPLPVELVSFDANYQDKQENVILTWETQNEQNFSHFEVEKSIDNVSFYDISTVNASTNNQQAKNYSTYDEEINAKIMFYRLKMIDLDGEVNYSKIVSINVNIRNSDILIYPNPSSNENITIELYSKELNKNLDISVIDVNGKIVLTQKFKVNNYIEKFELNTNNLSQGIYFIKIHGENLTKNFKHVIK